MLTAEKTSILKLLIALAWADGKVDQEELEVVNALIDAFDASAEEKESLFKWAVSPRSLDDVDVTNLDKSDLELALQHGVLLSYIDGEQSEKEVALIDALITKLGFSKEEAEPILASANEFAKQLLPELES